MPVPDPVLRKDREMDKLTPDLAFLNKESHVVKANEAFYRWEEKHYIRETPFSDLDRHVWVMGYLEAVREIIERIEK
jgi:hypothetical protein